MTATGLTLLAMKQTLSKAHREELELSILINFDATKRGHGTNYGANVISKHLLIGQCVASMQKKKPLYDVFTRGILAFSTACFRQGEELSLTTGEYKATKEALVAYLTRVLPVIEWKHMIGADAHVSERLGIEPLEFLK